MFRIKLLYGYVLFLAIFAVAIVACENNATKIALYQTEDAQESSIDNLEMNVGRTTLRISGGSGVYSVRSSDCNIAKAWIANDYLHIVAKKTGLVELLLVDDVNQTKSLQIDIQPKIRLFSVQDSRAEIEVEANSKEGKKAISYIEDIVNGQLKTKGMYYKFIYDELNAGKVVIYPRGLVEEFKIDGTFKSRRVDSSQTLFEINVNGLVREYSLVETPDNNDFSLKKGLFIENYSNDFDIESVKVVKALGVEVVFYK